MRASYKATIVLCAFFVSVFIISLLLNPHYPVLIIAGESSVGTWMSGVLLIMSATISLIIAIRQNSYRWILVTAFFIMLAVDERFMVHEQLKERIIFSFQTATRWIYELPVIVGACIGVLVVLFLWKYFDGTSRLLLVCAAMLGTASVITDVLAAGVLWEECFKLVAELLMPCALLRKVDEQRKV